MGAGGPENAAAKGQEPEEKELKERRHDVGEAEGAKGHEENQEKINSIVFTDISNVLSFHWKPNLLAG